MQVQGPVHLPEVHQNARLQAERRTATLVAALGLETRQRDLGEPQRLVGIDFHEPVARMDQVRSGFPGTVVRYRQRGA